VELQYSQQECDQLLWSTFSFLPGSAARDFLA